MLKSSFTPHDVICKCGVVFEDLHNHGLCFSCKISTIRFDSVASGEGGFSEREIVAANKAVGRDVVRATQSDNTDKRDFAKATPRPTLSDETKRLIHHNYGR